MTSELFRRNQTKQIQNDASDLPQSSPGNSTNSVRSYLAEPVLLMLVGIAIAALFFNIVPRQSPFSNNLLIDGSSAGSELPLPTRRVLLSDDNKEEAAVTGRVPLGLQRKSKRIVVTGGPGFVGSHLVDRLLKRGDSVIVVDNFFTGRKENLLHHFGNPNFELIRHDVVEPILLEVD